MPSAQYTADFCRYLAHIQKAFKVQIYLDSVFAFPSLLHRITEWIGLEGTFKIV